MDKACAVLFGSVLLVVTCITGQVKGDKIDDDGSQLNQNDLPYFDQLDDNFQLRWNFNSTHIIFQTRVKTKGYIGFGISDHGSMFPADVVIAWVKNDQVYFKDRHTTGHFMPSIDASQDWDLISGSEDDQYTTITMMRLLETCDSDDMDITDSTTRLIYSYSPTDPESHNKVFYHGLNRGSKSVLLLSPTSSENEKIDLPDDVIMVDVLNRNYSVPSSDTTYNCQAFKLPPLNGKHHIIRYEPVIQKGHEKLIHHMDFHFCRPNIIRDELKDVQYRCYEDPVPGKFDECVHILLAWAIGGTAFNFPSHIGYPLGGADDPVYFYLETHYDNPQLRDDFVDSSGLRLYLTKQLRQHDAGLIQMGVNVDEYQIIPPFTEDFLSRGICHKKCLDQILGDDEIYIFADTLHSHLLGNKLATRHFRNGTELPPIVEDNNYDFDYQEQRLLKEERAVRKGDSLITDCHYDSSKISSITYGGLSTREEMCISFLLYYPKKPLTVCTSRPIYNVDDQFSIFETATGMDFTNKTVQDEFTGMISDSKMVQVCAFYNDIQFSLTDTPVIDKPFVPESRCADKI